MTVSLTMLPNILSCSRIVLSVLLLFVADKPVGFIVLYCICGLTDVADGYLARKYNAITKLGSRLDSLGDFTFYAVCLYVFYRFIKGGNLKLIIACMAGIAVIRVTNLVITKVKFGQWGMTHTIGNKIAGFVLFLALPLYVFTGNAPLWSLAAAGFISAISALEETAILLRHTTYDVDRRSVLSKQKSANATIH